MARTSTKTAARSATPLAANDAEREPTQISRVERRTKEDEAAAQRMAALMMRL